jgi:hypothetical protein
MKSNALALCLACGISASLGALPPRPRPLPQAQTTGAAVGFTADKGKFRILQGGNEVGTEEFDLAPSGNSWIAKGEAAFRAPGGGEARSSGQLRVAADGTPLRYDWSAGTDKKASGSVTFEDGVAKSTINLPGKDEPVNQDFKFASPHTAILDNNLYDQYAILGRLYDWNAKGVQNFPVLIPQDLTPGTIDVEAISPQSAESGKFEVLRVHTSDLEIQLFFDAKHHLMRLEVPAAKVVIVRQ